MTTEVVHQILALTAVHTRISLAIVRVGLTMTSFESVDALAIISALGIHARCTILTRRQTRALVDVLKIRTLCVCCLVVSCYLCAKSASVMIGTFARVRANTIDALTAVGALMITTIVNVCLAAPAFVASWTLATE